MGSDPSWCGSPSIESDRCTSVVRWVAAIHCIAEKVSLLGNLPPHYKGLSEKIRLLPDVRSFV